MITLARRVQIKFQNSDARFARRVKAFYRAGRALGCKVALLAETALLPQHRIALLAPNPAQLPTTLYKWQATPALNLYYNCGAVSRT